MDLREKELKVDVDLESGGPSSGEESCNDHVSANGTFNRVWSGVLIFDGLCRGESDINSSSNSLSFNGGESENVELIEKSSAEYLEHTALVDSNCAEEKQKKINVRKPSKPPRPPKGPTLDLADQKLVREIAELAMRKRARTKRMQALKKMKASKPSSSSSNSVYALIITVLFCLVIIFQGISSKSIGTTMTVGSPAPAVTSSSEALVSVQLYKKFSNE